MYQVQINNFKFTNLIIQPTSFVEKELFREIPSIRKDIREFVISDRKIRFRKRHSKKAWVVLIRTNLDKNE